MKDHNLEKFVTWITRNPELAKKVYPGIMKGITRRINEAPSFYLANIIQNMPGHFPKWKSEIEQLTGLTRIKKVESYLSLTNLALSKEYEDKVIDAAVESVKDELIEMKDEFEKMLQPESETANESTNEKKKDFTQQDFDPLTKRIEAVSD